MKLVAVMTFLTVALFACGGFEKADAMLTATAHPPSLPTPDLAQLARTGQRLAEQKGCLGCHPTDGGTAVGPTWLGLIGSTRQFEDGTSALADDEYIRQSIRDPKAKIVKDFLDLMPTDLQVSDRDVGAIIAYIETLK